jgi:hypothetical protein
VAPSSTTRTRAHAELRVLGVVTVLCWVLPGPCFGAYGAAANSMRMAALSTTFEPAKLEEGEEPLVLRLHPQARGRSSWTTAIPVRGASPLREELVRPQRTTKGKGKEVTHSLPLSTYSAPGALRQDPGCAAELSAEARTCGNQGAAACRIAGGTRGAVAGTRCGGAGVRAAGLRGAASRHATLLNGGFHD